jgi:hypothetical protein
VVLVGAAERLRALGVELLEALAVAYDQMQ